MLDGLKDVQDKLQQLIDGLDKVALQGIMDAAVRLGTDAQARAPVEYGDLRGSLFIDINGRRFADGQKGGGLEMGEQPEPYAATEAVVGFSSPYAAAQHEHIEYNHPSLARQARQRMGGVDDPYFSDAGEAKYLERPLNELIDSGDLLRIITGKM